MGLLMGIRFQKHSVIPKEKPTLKQRGSHFPKHWATLKAMAMLKGLLTGLMKATNSVKPMDLKRGLEKRLDLLMAKYLVILKGLLKDSMKVKHLETLKDLLMEIMMLNLCLVYRWRRWSIFCQ